MLPCKHGTNSSETPETKDTEVFIWLKKIGHWFTHKFRRDGGYNIKQKPGFCVPQSNSLWVINHTTSWLIKISNKECEDNVNGKKWIGYVV